MNDLIDKYLGPLKKYVVGILGFLSSHKALFVVVVACGAMLLTLSTANSFLEPARNEEIYQEEILKINIKKIDQDAVEDISSTLEDPNIEVTTDFNPGRDNPFVE